MREMTLAEAMMNEIDEIAREAMTVKPVRDNAALDDATNVGGLTPTDEPGIRRGHTVELIPGESHTMVDGKVLLDGKELIGVSRMALDVGAGKPLPKIQIEMRVGRIITHNLPVDLYVEDERTADRMIDILSAPTRISLQYVCIDDLEVDRKAIIFKIKWIMSIFLRFWPFYLRISFPTRKKVGKALLEKKVWVNPWIKIGEIH